MKFEPISTPRLELSELKKEYAPYFFALRSDTENGKYLHRAPAQTLADAEAHVEKVLKSAPTDKLYFWVILFKNEENYGLDFAGLICLWNLDWERRRAEIGYELLPVFQGKRIVQEAMPEILKFGFEKIGLLEIVAGVDKLNEKSVRILERFGFEPRSEDPPFVDYALSSAKFLNEKTKVFS